MVNDITTKGTFFSVFNFRDPDARSRCFILLSAVINGVTIYLNAGVFYTGFLTGYGMDIMNVGLLTVVPYIASMFVIFTPALLNLFPKRRWVLAVCKLLFYLISLGGLNLLPLIVRDSAGRFWGMIVIIFLASLFDIIATSGYAAWHVRFMPENIRAYYMSTSMFLTALISGVFVLVSGSITDLLSEMGDRQLGFIVGIRYFAMALGIVSVIFLLLPREVSHPVLHTPRFSDIFTIPLRNRKFLLTMAASFMWMFTANCYTAQLNVYLLETIGVSYTFYNVIILLYGMFFIFFAGFWQRMIRKYSWFGVYTIALLIAAPLQILYGFVQPGNYVLLLLAVRLPQHFAGVGHNVAFANFQYINMPITNRECYTSFYQVIANLGGFCGVAFGTVFTKLTEGFSFTAFGYTYTSGVPLLTMFCGVAELFICLFIFCFRRQLRPDMPEIHSA